jgi:hypothetical protein
MIKPISSIHLTIAWSGLYMQLVEELYSYLSVEDTHKAKRKTSATSQYECQAAKLNMHAQIGHST